MQTCDTRQCKNIKKCHALHGYAVRKCCLYVADGRQRSSSEHLRLKHDCNLKMKSEANNQLQKGRFKKLKPNERLRPEAPDVRGCSVCIRRHRKSEARPTEEKSPTMTEKRKLKPFKPGRWNFSLNPTMIESNHLKMLQASERCEYNIVKGAEDVDYRRGLQHETQP